MYKVLIVDDEYYFRQALKISLPWAELGFQIAGEAKNGAEALALLPELQPDVVLVDMNMPIMDGIEFIQKAKQRDGETKFMVLSGHSEFVYARQAVHLGVFDYVLKPIDEGELRGSLLDMKEQIRTERQGRTELEDLRKQASESLPAWREQVLNGWLQGSGQASVPGSERLASLGIQLGGPYFQTVVIDLDPCDDWNREEDLLARKAVVQEIALRDMQSVYQCAVCRDYEDRLVLIVGSPDDSFDGLESLCKGIRDKIRALPCSVTIGIGSGSRSLASVAASYKDALLALKRRFFNGGQRGVRLLPHGRYRHERQFVSGGKKKRLADVHADREPDRDGGMACGFFRGCPREASFDRHAAARRHRDRIDLRGVSGRSVAKL
ncbi:response regulator [Cohnella rhizosphaerae]|uniref:Response regulator n=1 Tax=Cohnella rhizosphaerae TaxID=1457232 RepID=A0A9X4KSC9_9BACL|nr:response regulator [Cohnella rhizosphaerae]MDG0810274.1 response regulator [Cohnella rhizosphaerae]